MVWIQREEYACREFVLSMEIKIKGWKAFKRSTIVDLKEIELCVCARVCVVDTSYFATANNRLLTNGIIADYNDFFQIF